MDCNQTVICGNIVKLGILRYTPAGVAVIEFEISHASHQMEAGVSRQVTCDVFAVALGQMALTISGIKTGSMVKLTGFITKKSRNNQQLVLHVDHVVKL